MQFFDLEPSHAATVHDIAFDFYGKRFASCSSDRSIKVWDLVEEAPEHRPQGVGAGGRDDGEVPRSTSRWVCSEIAKPHTGSIWRLSWAHPEFGQIFASCSEDKSVIIWEEQEILSAVGEGEGPGGRWLKKTQLFDSKKSVNAVQFSPRQLGLKLATASADGIVRIYEANDVFSLNYWPLQDSFQVTEDQASAAVSVSVIAGAEQQQQPQAEHGLTCLAWSDCPFELPRLVVGGYSKVAVVWVCEGSKWKQELALEMQLQPIHDLAWAPAMGRSYHLIACASRETSFHIHTLRREEGGLVLQSSVRISSPSEVWRVAWNSTGTVLSTAAEDGSLRLWRRNFTEEWVSVQDLPLVGSAKAVYANTS
mmetsp:Transcript_22016/g.37189  ORF Transcript_22016/g.37189 Transcript_22016/m.37189 type:complete len:365 (+) Transcript_22016:54-1148(+)